MPKYQWVTMLSHQNKMNSRIETVQWGVTFLWRLPLLFWDVSLVSIGQMDAWAENLHIACHSPQTVGLGEPLFLFEKEGTVSALYTVYSIVGPALPSGSVRRLPWVGDAEGREVAREFSSSDPIGQGGSPSSLMTKA